MRGVGAGWLAVAFALAAAWLCPGPAHATPASVSEWPLADADLEARSIVTGADGNFWLGVERYAGRGEYHEPTFDSYVERITPDSDFTSFPAGEYGVGALAPGPDGNIWFLAYEEYGYFAPSGQVTRFRAPGVDFLGSELAAGADGNMWATERNDSGPDMIIRISPTGETTQFPLPHRESAPASIVAGPDGNLWFGETFGERIGRITTSGSITEFPVGERVSDLTVGPDGNIWFNAEGSLRRLEPTGAITKFDLGKGRFAGSQIISGPDGRLWFGEGANQIGRISPGGRVSRVRLPTNGRRVDSLTIGPEGAVWFSAVHAETCGGGGFTCMNWFPSRNLRVGRVVPGALGIVVSSGSARVKSGSAAVSLRCEEGLVDDVCSGTLALRKKRRGARAASLGEISYRLHTDSQHTFRIRLRRPAIARLLQRGRLEVTAIATRDSGETVRRSIILLPAPRPPSR